MRTRMKKTATLLIVSILVGGSVFTRANEIVLTQEPSVTTGGHSSGIQTSADGSIIAFLSDAPDLVEGVPLGRVNLYRKDLASGAIEWIVIDAPGRFESYAMSADGELFTVCLRRRLEPNATSPATADIYLWSDVEGLRKISESAIEGEIPDGDCWDPWITPDGRFVFFRTYANNLLPGHYFNDYGFGVVRYNVENGLLDAGIPLFFRYSGSGESPVLFSPDGNFVYTRQDLPADWEGESPYKGQATSRLVNIFKIDEQQVIVPPPSVDLILKDLVASSSMKMRLDPSGFWVSIVSLGNSPSQFSYSYEALLALNVNTFETVVAPQAEDERLFGPIAVGDYFDWKSGAGTMGVWNRERGFVTGGAGTEGVKVTAGAVASPDDRWIATANPFDPDTARAGRMILWNLDSGDVTEFGPPLEGIESPGFGNPNFVFSGDSRYLFFETAHPGFVENDNNRATDVFRYSIETGEILPVSARNPELPLPHDGLTISAPVVENAVTRIFHKHSIHPDEPWIEAATAVTDDGRVKFKDTGSSIHQHKFYKSETEPVAIP